MNQTSSKRNWWKLIAPLLVLVFVFTYALARPVHNPTLPENIGKLADGSTVRLRQLTTGPYHEYFDSENANAWERLVHSLPRKVRKYIFGDLAVLEYTSTPNPNSLGIWIERDYSTKLQVSLQIRVHDDQGNDERAISYMSVTRPTHSMISTLARNFPRRAENLSIELYEDARDVGRWSKVVTWEVANPMRFTDRATEPLVTNQTFMGYEIRANLAQMRLATNKTGKLGTEARFKFTVTRSEEPSGDWMIHDIKMTDATGNSPWYSERKFTLNGGSLMWSGWENYRSRESPFRLRVFLQPNQFTSSNQLESTRRFVSVTNQLNQPGGLTNRAQSFDVFGHQMQLAILPTTKGGDTNMVLSWKTEIDDLDISLVSIVDQQARYLPIRQSSIQQTSNRGYTFPIRAFSDSTTIVTKFKFQSLVEANFVVAPTFASQSADSE